ncbi:MFS transporter [Brevibacterium luteolum]|uniref:MFS transporter n=1 Tax=Brevibacterium luteolum TaxID=199591 RepID=UPI003B978876
MATVASGLGFYVPVSALFLLSRGQSLSDVFIFETILGACILVAEVPSGIIADRIDRKWVIIAGFGFNAVAETLFAFAQSHLSFSVSFALSGMGIAILTGALDAYVYDALGAAAENRSVGVWGHLSSLELVAGVIASACGGLLAAIDIAWPAIATAVAASIGALATGLLPAQPMGTSSPTGESESSLQQLRQGVVLLFSTPILLHVVAASGACFVLFNAVFTLNQPLFAASGVPVATWGFIVAGAQLTAAFYNHWAGWIEASIGRKRALLLAMACGAAGFGLMAMPHAHCGVGGFFLVVIGMHARGPITLAVANQVIPKVRRATVLNIASSFGSLVGIAVNPIIGAAADVSAPLASAGIAAVLLGVAVSWIPVVNRYLGDPQRPVDRNDSEG